MKSILLAIIFGVIGLVVGYLIYGQINGNYIELDLIFSQKTGFFDNLAASVFGIDDMKKQILTFGAGGFVLGLILGAIPSRSYGDEDDYEDE